MCFPKNFTDVLRTLTLQNAGRLLLLKYLLKIKIAASNKFSEAEIFFKIDGLMAYRIYDGFKNLAFITKKYLVISCRPEGPPPPP